MTESVQPQLHALSLSKLLDDHLKSKHVYDDIRSVLQNYVNQQRLAPEKQTQLLNQLASFSSPNAEAKPTARPLRLLANTRYLSIRLVSGKGFVHNLTESSSTESLVPNDESTLTAHLQFGQHRFTSSPIPASVDPRFDARFVIPLQTLDEDSSADEMQLGKVSMMPLDLVAQLPHVAQLCIVKHSHPQLHKDLRPSTSELLSTIRLADWRRVCIHGRSAQSLELQSTRSSSIQGTIGLLQIEYEILPLQYPSSTDALPIFIESPVVESRLNSQRTHTDRVSTRFHRYLTAWYTDYISHRRLHETRSVKLLARDESDTERCVCTFVSRTVCERGSNIRSAFDAHRFVLLLPLQPGGMQQSEQWHSLHAMFALRKTTVQGRALLLCSLLTGFGMNAFVAIVTTKSIDRRSGGPANVSDLSATAHTTLTVLTKDCESSAVTFWDCVNGRRYIIDSSLNQRRLQSSNDELMSLDDAHQLPYERLFCLFNDRQFYANQQLEDAIELMQFTLSDAQQFKSIHEAAIAVLPKRPAIMLRAPVLNAKEEAEALEEALMKLVTDFRREYTHASTHWDRLLAYRLEPALAAYELHASTGSIIGNDEFQSAVRHSVPLNHAFQAIPVQLQSLHANQCFATLCADKQIADLMQECEASSIKFALRVSVTMYAEDLAAVWCMIAQTKRADDAY